MSMSENYFFAMKYFCMRGILFLSLRPAAVQVDRDSAGLSVEFHLRVSVG